MKIIISIKAILFGVTESIIGKLDIGNSYKIQKDSLTNSKLWKEFDYTDFGIRRIYEMAKLNDNLDVALLVKEQELNDSDLSFARSKGIRINEQSMFDYLNDLEINEIRYIDMKMRVIRLFSENSFNIKELLFNVFIIDNEGNRTSFFNSKIPFFDTVYSYVSDLSVKGKKELTKIDNFINDTQLPFSNIKFDPETLESACFLYDQTYTAPNQTLRFMTGVIGIESLVVNDNTRTDLKYKFVRNCGMLLSNNENEYKELCKNLENIYKLRSEYVHCGRMKGINEKSVVNVREILRKIIFKIVELDISKKQMLEKLDLKGYMVSIK